MSYFYSRPFGAGDRFTDSENALPFMGGGRFAIRSADHAVDLALKSVPLPEGLMSRLGALVNTMPDEAADQVDYLGC